MDPIYLIIVIILLALAATDLMVGVANDAVNFLNSSLGSKVAPRWVILLVASVGVLVGAMFSSGMMEVARSGVFFPEKFTFPSIMILFLAVMLTDVILLDVFNTFGLPTSTTVSLVFELLGSAVAVSIVLIAQNDTGDLSQYINSTKALAIISGIFISIAIAFVVGTFVMFLSRTVFSFKYRKPFLYFGALWGGIALTAITYFAVFKGLKGSALISDEFLNYLTHNMGQALLYTFGGWTLLMFIFQFVFRIRILNFIVLSGTLALALAFAGNDLVNFIGVFMAGLDTYQIGLEHYNGGGDLNTLYMGELAKPVIAKWQWLLGAGVIMIIALWTSKKAHTVSDTEVNLARSGEGGIERFSSSPLSRSIVRGAINMNKAVEAVVPEKVNRWINSRFEIVPVENGASFDLIRASVNLTVASLLIALGTSLKLPLSTTYVTFMVAMGTSLADRAWGRESAVYRISGVLTVIAGWLLTALIAFSASLIIGMFLMWGGKIAVLIMVLLAGFTMYKSSKLHSKRKSKENRKKNVMSSEEQLVLECNKDAERMFEKTKTIFLNMIEALRNEDRKLIKSVMAESDELYTVYKDKRNYEVVPTIEAIQANALDLEQEYVRMVDFSYEVSKSLKAMTESSYLYIDSNHSALTEEQLEDLTNMYEQMVGGFNHFEKMMETGDFSNYNSVVASRDAVYNLNNKLIKRQIKRLKNKESKTRSSILFLDLVNEIKIIMIQSNNLMKSQKSFNEQFKLRRKEMSVSELVKNVPRRM